MFIQAFPSGPYSTNAYVVSCEQTLNAIVIDPSPDSSSQIFDYLREHQLQCKAVWLTHSHWDHIADVKKVKEIGQIPVYVHSLDAPNLRQPGIDEIPFWIAIESVEPDVLLEDKMHLNVGQHPFEVIHTPGHSIGSVCFYCKEENVLFSGDTIFKGAIGNLNFLTSARHLMPSSLDRLCSLPKETKVYPGHGSPTTIGDELKQLSRYIHRE